MMRRRFGRRRWGGGGNGGGEGPRGLDAARELARVIQSGVVPADALDPVASDELPAALAAVGTGTSREGERLVVGVSPASGGDAWLAALAVATRLVQEEGFDGAVYAVSGSWPLSARRRLGLLRPGALRVRARIEPDAQDAVGEVTAEGIETPVRSPASLPAELAESARPLWRRATTALAGLGAKHGGTIRPAPAGIELVFAGKVVAVLRGDAQGVALEAWEPRRELLRLAPDALADAFDRFEGSLRKALADRRLREGEPARRAALATRLAEAAGVRALAPWPLAGPLGEGVDFAGLDGHGRAVVGVARPTFGLLELGAALDGWVELVPRVAALLPEAPAPSAARPLLVIVAERVEPAAERVLAWLDVEARLWSAEGMARGEPTLVPRPIPLPGAAVTAPARPPLAPVRPLAPAPRPVSVPAPVAAAPPAASAAPAAPAEESAGETGEEAPVRPHRFEEVSLFDLAAEGEEPAERTPSRRRRRRRRGRGRGRAAAAAAEGALRSEDEDQDDEDESEPGEELEAASGESPAEAEGGEREEPRGRRRRRRGRGRGRERPAPAALRDDLEADAEDLEDEELVALAELPEAEELEAAVAASSAVAPGVEDEEEDEEDEDESPEEARLREEREARRRARIAKAEPEPTPPPRPPRRRAAFLAHADRESIGAAVLLARETRLVEGIWIYPQNDLMTFFRGVATDLREDT
ncbi:MAG TPA: hypothetical protein VIN04_04185, partial [Myxococcota bacterium]